MGGLLSIRLAAVHRSALCQIAHGPGNGFRLAEPRIRNFGRFLQRVRLACAILSSPPVLLLDEPTATLDTRGVDIVRGIIDDAVSRGAVVIVATNESDEAAACMQQLDVENFR